MPSVVRRFNYGVEFKAEGRNHEEDLATCGHCQFQMRVPPPKDGHIISRILPPCPGCRRYICDECIKKVATEGCVTWEKRMEIEERRNALLKAMAG